MALELLAAKSKVENNDWHSITVLKHTGDVIQKALDLFCCIPSDLSAFGTKLSEKSFQKAVIKACFLHDLGKISYEFQDSIISHIKGHWNGNKEAVKAYLSDLKNVKISRHEYYSILWSYLLLNNEHKADQIQTAILYHHYNNFYVQEIMGGLKIYEGIESQVAIYLEFIKNKVSDFSEQFFTPIQNKFTHPIVKEAFEEMKQSMNAAEFDSKITAFQNNENISEHLTLYESHLSQTQNNGFGVSEYEFLLMLGCLRRSDYAASGNCNIENPFLDIYSDLDKKIVEKIGAEAWQFKIELTKITDGSISIIQAPTGSGKTELALVWAKMQQKKLFYTLPLRIALNDIYQKRLIGKSGYLQEKSDQVSLLHSTAFLEYLKEKSDLSVGEKISISKMLSNALYLSTIDQVFLSSLLYYGFDKLFSLYPYSCFVIDEIQSYTPEMMAVIFKTMEHIQKLGAPILVITATLPPFLEKILKIMNLKHNIISLPNDKKHLKNYHRKRHLIEIREEWICEDVDKELKVNKNLLKEISKNYEQNTLIILNNVSKAIKVFESLAVILKTDNNSLNEKDSGIYLLHSRLLESEKIRRIEQIKDSIENKEKRIIVVSTQLIEASVDFDFDILHSEWCPIDSLIQRMGRIHRNREDDFSGNSSNVFVYVGSKDEPDRLTSLIYSKIVLKATRKCLLENQNNKTKLDFNATNQLLKMVFNQKIKVEDVEKDVNELFINQVNKNLDFLKYFKASKRSEAQRIFRRLAGRSIICIDALLENEETKPFGKYLKDHFDNGSLFIESEKSWTTIFSENNFQSYSEEVYFNAMKWLLNASISIPEYYFSKITSKQPFKDFFLIMVDKQYSDLKTFGYDKINFDLEKDELGEII